MGPALGFLWIFYAMMLNSVNSQLNYDDGLLKGCEKMKGTFRQRSGPEDINGDKCDLKFTVSARDEADAREFCELYAPFRLNNVKIIEEDQIRKVICSVEATFTCKSGWKQLFGHCFRMPNRHETYTYKDAEELCKKTVDGGEIAYMHHRYMTGVYKNFFYGTGQIWLRASETWDRYIQKTDTADGDNLALAFTGKHFDFAVPAFSLVKLKSTIRLQVLCQYKPHITPAEINYIGRRYSEIYYPVIPVENGILVRSASSYTSSTDQIATCQSALKPFLTKNIGNFIPDQDTLDAISGAKLPLMTLTRSSAFNPFDMKKLKDPLCFIETPKLKVPLHSSDVKEHELKNFNEDSKCALMGSTAMTHFENQNCELKLMSDSRSLPIWCKLGHPTKMIFDTIPGYTVFQRANGEYVAHKLHSTQVHFHEASELCKKDGAFLSGISSLTEVEFLKSLAVATLNTAAPERGFWLGAQRREACRGMQIGFNTHGDCTKENVFEWLDGVSFDFDSTWWRDEIQAANPNFQNSETLYLTLNIGDHKEFDPKSKGFLDDVMPNYFKRHLFCQAPVSIKVESM